MSELRGITWDHPRGAGGLDATARIYNEAHEGTEVIWEKKPLAELRTQSLESLSAAYDLLVIGHPSVGSAAKGGCLVPLDTLIPSEFLELQHEQSTGASHRSYEYANHQWALAVDAGAQVSAYRPDLIESIPGDWDSVVGVALTSGARVAVPLLPGEAFDSFLTICANAGEPPFLREDVIVSREAGLHALALLHRLAGLVNRACFALDSAGLLDMMSTADEIAYAPLVFGYSNYSRKAFKPHPVRFANIPSSGNGPTGSLLGGAGIAISVRCPDLKGASEYLTWVCQPEVQRGAYFESGGQPGNRVAWLDEGVNFRSDEFFKRTLATLTGAYLRPRYEGFLEVQSECGKVIHEGLRGGRDPEKIYADLNSCYVGSRKGSTS